jgi:hypothetical protein
MPPSSVKRLDDKLDLVLASLGELKVDFAVMKEHSKTADESVNALANHVSKQNGRIGKLERWQWMVVGGATAVGVIGKVIVDTITH